MKMESQLCSLELSKKLRELGVKQKSMFYHINNIDEYKIVPVITDYDKEIFNILTHDILPPQVYSAFTVAELGEIIFQKNYDNLEETGYLQLNTEMIDRSGGYFFRLTHNFSEHIIDDYSEADARARLLIMLLENKLLK